MGNILLNKNIFPDLVLSSPAKRALSTAIIISNIIGYKENKIIIDRKLYMAENDEFIEIISKLNNKFKNIFVFGHNNGITDFANYCGSLHIENIPTCGIVKIDFDIMDWCNIKNIKGNTDFFIYPKMFKNGAKII
jgi:phosphohistidine phosphatase